MSYYEQKAARDAAEAERWAKIAEHARKQGLALVQMRPRTYIVIRLSDANGVGSHGGKYITHLTGEMVFSGSWEGAKLYIAAEGQPLTEELARP